MKQSGGLPRSRLGAVIATETAMKKIAVVAVSVAAFTAAIVTAWAGPPMSRDNAAAPDAKMPTRTPTAEATAPSTEALKLSDAQRKVAWQDLYMDSLNQDTPPGFTRSLERPCRTRL